MLPTVDVGRQECRPERLAEAQRHQSTGATGRRSAIRDDFASAVAAAYGKLAGTDARRTGA